MIKSTLRDKLKSLMGLKVTVKIKQQDGQYFNDLANEIFTISEV